MVLRAAAMTPFTPFKRGKGVFGSRAICAKGVRILTGSGKAMGGFPMLGAPLPTGDCYSGTI